MKQRHAEQGHPMQGKHHTEEAKQKISEAGKGRKVSPESARKTAEANMMSKEKEQLIIDLYTSGMRISEIEKQHGIKTSAIYRVLERNNIEKRGCKREPGARKHTEETKQLMSQKYWNRINSENCLTPEDEDYDPDE